jgi:hypothetical protein
VLLRFYQHRAQLPSNRRVYLVHQSKRGQNIPNCYVRQHFLPLYNCDHGRECSSKDGFDKYSVAEPSGKPGSCVAISSLCSFV